MKNIILFVLLLSFSSFVYPQQDIKRCGTTEYMEYMMRIYPEFAANMQSIEKKMQELIAAQQRDGRSQQTVITVPVVVHVIWNTAAQNISEEMIVSQVRVLNEDYRKMPGTPGWNTHPSGADVKVQFRLADRDPNGLPHGGINRVYTTKTSWAISEDAQLKALSYWPSDKFLNIWVANLSGGILGYSPYPGGPATRDGVVILYSAFGFGSPYYPYNMGRTLTHELGHWFNLIHTWGDMTDCSGTDYCADTPPCSGQYFSQVPNCTAPYQCSNTRQIQNYMDYSDDGCMNMFTNDQTTRVRAAYSIYRNTLLASQTEALAVTQTGTEYPFTDYASQTFAGITFSSLGSATNVSVEVFPNYLPYNMPPGTKAVKRFFNISANGTGFNASIKLYYKDAEVSGFTNGENNLKLYKWENNNWVYMGGTVNTVNNYIALDNVTSFSSWAMADPNDSPIPVELSSFTAEALGYNVHLRWMTSTEVNNLGFEIERAVVPPDYRNINWQSVSFVKGQGTTTELRRYSFTDENLQPASYLYRLKLTDNDGSFSYSEPVEVDIESPHSYILEQNYPNPFNPSTTIAFTLPEQSYITLKIHDALGKEVAVLFRGNKDAGTYEMQFDASDIPSGIYYYTLNANGFSQTNKMMLLK